MLVEAMQTFLPYPDFERSLAVLDYRRLGKQRVEAHQILAILRGQQSSWVSHPAVRMWRGYEGALVAYYNAALREWAARGYRNIILQPLPEAPVVVMPPWLGREDFHASHRSKLLAKNPEHYSQFGWREEPGLPYVWPV
jgi:hypothetical protein